MKFRTYLIALFVISFRFNISAQITFENAFPNLTFKLALEMVPANDGTKRQFVATQNGLILVIPNINTAQINQVDTFLNIGFTGSNKILYNSGEERGLLGMAFHPNYANNGFFFLYYTAQGTTTTKMVLARYEVDPSNPKKALQNSETRLLAFDKTANNSNHNGGKIAFGPDGYLYVSVGDGGGSGDQQNNAQNKSVLFGKMLRLDVDQKAGNVIVGNYAIPADNPFASSGGSERKEIYAFGIRNMWKFSFDTTTNRLWGADVGQNLIEEIDLVVKGGNYGWRKYEGNNTYNTTDASIASAIAPIYTYPRSDGQSITGGYVYRGTEVPSLTGKYIYGDYVSGRVWALSYDVGTPINQLLFQAKEGSSNINITSFGLDEKQELYFMGPANGQTKIYKFKGSVLSLEKEANKQKLHNFIISVPNPTNGIGTIHYELIQNGEIQVQLRDLQGKTQMVWDEKQREIGSYDLSYQINSLPTGSYQFLLLVNGQIKASQKVILDKSK